MFLMVAVIVIAWADVVSRDKPKDIAVHRKAEKEMDMYYTNVCDACGKHPKQPNSMLCKECEEKANDNSDS
jgi:hypothetical protein